MKNVIECPYCSKEQEAFIDHLNQFKQNGEYTQECIDCSKEFHVKFQLVFETEKK